MEEHHLRTLFRTGSRVQEQWVLGRRVLLSYGTERMLWLSEEADNDNLLRYPDIMFTPGELWQSRLEEDPGFRGRAFYPFVEILDFSTAVVIPFTVQEGRLQDLRIVIPSELMIAEVGEWLEEVGDEVRESGGETKAESYLGSFHIWFNKMKVSTLVEMLDMAMSVGISMLIVPASPIVWVRTRVAAESDPET